MKLQNLTVVLLAGLLPVSSAQAHHAFGAEFDPNRPLLIKGEVIKVEWVNPHGWIHMDIEGEDGRIVNWAVEMGNPTALLRRGLRKSDFPPGIGFVVEGYLAKDGTPTANGITVTFPDGRNFFAGSSGTGAPVPTPRQ